MSVTYIQPAKLTGGNVPAIEGLHYDETAAAQTFGLGAIMREVNSADKVTDEIAAEAGVDTASTALYITDGTAVDIPGALDLIGNQILGVALHRAGSTPGLELGHAGDVQQVTSFGASPGGIPGTSKVSIVIANRNTVFSAPGDAAFVFGDIGLFFGLIRSVVDGFGFWQINKLVAGVEAVSTTAVAKVEDVIIETGANAINYALFTIDQSALARIPA